MEGEREHTHTLSPTHTHVFPHTVCCKPPTEKLNNTSQTPLSFPLPFPTTHARMGSPTFSMCVCVCVCAPLKERGLFVEENQTGRETDSLEARVADSVPSTVASSVAPPAAAASQRSAGISHTPFHPPSLPIPHHPPTHTHKPPSLRLPPSLPSSSHPSSSTLGVTMETKSLELPKVRYLGHNATPLQNKNRGWEFSVVWSTQGSRVAGSF